MAGPDSVDPQLKRRYQGIQESILQSAKRALAHEVLSDAAEFAPRSDVHQREAAAAVVFGESSRLDLWSAVQNGRGGQEQAGFGVRTAGIQAWQQAGVRVCKRSTRDAERIHRRGQFNFNDDPR